MSFMISARVIDTIAYVIETLWIYVSTVLVPLGKFWTYRQKCVVEVPPLTVYSGEFCPITGSVIDISKKVGGGSQE